MTMKSILKLGAAAALMAPLLVACATGPTLAPAGKLSVVSAYSVNLDRNWSDVTTLYVSGKAPKVKVLTIDGINLNRLLVSDGLTSSDPLVVSPTKGDTATNPAPRGKADMSLSEQMEFVSRAVSELDYQKVETLNPKPVTLGGVKGVRFELSGKTSDGLNIKGTAQAVSSKGLSYYIVYLAPAEHYYDASLTNAVAVMDSAKLP